MNETGGGAWSDASVRESSTLRRYQEPGLTVAEAAQDFGVQGTVAPVGAGVCRRYVGDLSGPGIGEARAGGTRTAPPCSHQVKDGA